MTRKGKPWENGGTWTDKWTYLQTRPGAALCRLVLRASQHRAENALCKQATRTLCTDDHYELAHGNASSSTRQSRTCKCVRQLTLSRVPGPCRTNIIWCRFVDQFKCPYTTSKASWPVLCGNIRASPAQSPRLSCSPLCRSMTTNSLALFTCHYMQSHECFGSLLDLHPGGHMPRQQQVTTVTKPYCPISIRPLELINMTLHLPTNPLLHLPALSTACRQRLLQQPIQ